MIKKLIILFALSVPFVSKSQDSTIVTNLSMKAGTIRLIVGTITINESSARPFIKWSDTFIYNPPANDNANVLIDTIETTFIAQCYQALLSMSAGNTEVDDFIGDFKTSIQSKRNQNTYLDSLCDALELSFINSFEAIKQRGNKMLTGN